MVTGIKSGSGPINDRFLPIWIEISVIVYFIQFIKFCKGKCFVCQGNVIMSYHLVLIIILD